MLQKFHEHRKIVSSNVGQCSWIVCGDQFGRSPGAHDCWNCKNLQNSKKLIEFRNPLSIHSDLQLNPTCPQCQSAIQKLFTPTICWNECDRNSWQTATGNLPNLPNSHPSHIGSIANRQFVSSWSLVPDHQFAIVLNIGEHPINFQIVNYNWQLAKKPELELYWNCLKRCVCKL